MFEGDNYRKPIVHHLIEYAAQIIRFGKNFTKLLAISLAARKLQSYNFCFADLLVHDI